MSENEQVKSDESGIRHPIPKSRFWIWFWGVAIFLVAMTFITLGMQFRHVPLQISKETTYVIEPLTPDGKSVDYLVAFEEVAYSDKITSDENGFRLLVESFGLDMISSPSGLEAICRKLGLDVKSLKTSPTYRDPYSFLTDWIRGAQFDEELVRSLASKQVSVPSEDSAHSDPISESEAQEIVEMKWSLPWTSSELPMMKKWLDDSDDSFALIAAAVRKPLFECPLGNRANGMGIQSILMEEIQWCRSIARGLSVRINFRVGNGDIEGVIDDVETCILLGRHLQNQFLAIQFSVGVSIEDFAHSFRLFGFEERVGTREQLLRLQTLGQTIQVKPRTELEALFQRFSYLESIAMMSDDPDNEISDEQEKSLIKRGIDWNIVARTFNRDIDSNQVRSKPSTDAELEITFRDYVSRSSRSRRLGRLLASGFSTGDYFNEPRNRSKCRKRMRQIVLAMLLYEKDHGTLPPAYTVAKNGEPLHSWRVLILPYLGQQELYDQLKLDEPWDSAHNKKYWTADVPFFKCPSDKDSGPGQANYSVVIGPDYAFSGSQGKRLDSFAANDSSLILVVERLDDVCWLDPSNEISVATAGLGINPQDHSIRKRLPGISSLHPAGAQFGFRDGSVEFISQLIQQESLESMLNGTHVGDRR